MGIEVWFVEDVVPTPMIMFAVDQEDLAIGIMITASHNPSEYNGIKIIVEGGKDAPVEVTNRIEELCGGDSSPAGSTHPLFQAIDEGKLNYIRTK